MRPRRLGTRGNSRYCYAGLRKRLRLDSPLTPDLGAEGAKGEKADSEEELTVAASFLIREWVEKLLGVKFDTLTDLACHLLEKMYVDNRSVAAFTLLSSGARLAGNGKPVLASPQGEAKHRDAQLQLQRKLQERQEQEREEGARMEQKRKLGQEQEGLGAFPHALAQHGVVKRSKVGEEFGEQQGGLPEYEMALENGQQQRYSVVVPNSQADHYVVNGGGMVGGEGFEGAQDFSTGYPGERGELGSTSPLALLQPSLHHRQGTISLDKLPRKKQALAEAAASLAMQQGVLCLDASQQLVLAGHTSVIKAGEKPKNKYKEAAEVGGWGEGAADMVEVKGEAMGWEGGLGYDEPADLTTLGRGAWDKAVNNSGGNSSDAQEEELVRYFADQPADGGKDADNKDQKLSQLRQLLEKQLKSPTLSVGGGAFKRTSVSSRDLAMPLKQEEATSQAASLEPTLTTNSTPLNLNTNLSSRRRVSFNPLIVSDPAAITESSMVQPMSGPGGTCPVPPSPGARRRHFSFQPISPRQSLPQSPPASPFISPRSTPVHMLRSRHSSGSALPLHLLPGSGQQAAGRQQHPSGSGSDISRAATFGSASESSTPFISPQGTPIPFNRSRHNSAQGRLCRSRCGHLGPSPGPLSPYSRHLITWSLLPGLCHLTLSPGPRHLVLAT